MKKKNYSIILCGGLFLASCMSNNDKCLQKLFDEVGVEKSQIHNATHLVTILGNGCKGCIHKALSEIHNSTDTIYIIACKSKKTFNLIVNKNIDDYSNVYLDTKSILVELDMAKNTPRVYLLNNGKYVSHSFYGNESPSEEANTTITFNTNEIDLGKISRTEKARIKFTIWNTGKNIVRISHIDLSCECLNIENEITEINPGDRTKMEQYYYNHMDKQKQAAYHAMLQGIRNLTDEFQIPALDADSLYNVFFQLRLDHPELFWVHNREKVYKTTYSGRDYCQFSPGYTYTEEQRQEITQAMENAYQEVLSQIPDGADDYTKVMTVYTYVIDNTEYVISDDDQSIAGAFWKKQAVCAGYAGAVQYLLERLDIPCIYVEGDAANSTQGHAWNIVELNGQYYYVDATNGDQPDFLEGDATLLAEHKTTIYDYLCPFPQEYEENYTASDEFPVPACTATDMNFYVRNGACFDTYDWSSVYDLCRLRIDSDAAVVRFKFGSQGAYDEAYMDLIDSNHIQDIAKYYMEVHGLSQISYHYGVIDNMKTLYFMF